MAWTPGQDYVLPVTGRNSPTSSRSSWPTTYSDIGGDSVGLRLALRPRELQPSLFEAFGVEPE